MLLVQGQQELVTQTQTNTRKLIIKGSDTLTYKHTLFYSTFISHKHIHWSILLSQIRFKINMQSQMADKLSEQGISLSFDK